LYFKELNESKRLKQFGICISSIEALGDNQVSKCLQLGINAVSLSEKDIKATWYFPRDIAR